MDRIGVVTGLRFEARLLETAARRAGVFTSFIVASGLGETAARAAAETLLRGGATALLSFGLAGGLDPSLRCGTVLAPTQVITMHGTPLPCDPSFFAHLGPWASHPLPHVRAPLAHTPHVLATVADKTALRIVTQACAADMESVSVGTAAREAGVPFAVLRVIADEADEDLPSIALEAAGPDGTVHVMRSVGLALRHPWQIPGLIRLGRSTAHATRVLDQLAQAMAAERLSASGR